MEKIERVGIIGLGRMGRPMTRHLIEKGFAVTGFDVSDGAMAAAALGAVKAGDLFRKILQRIDELGPPALAAG